MDWIEHERKKIVKETSEGFGMNNWKNCVAISGDGKAGGGTDLGSEGDGELSDNDNICPASLTGLIVMIHG